MLLLCFQHGIDRASLAIAAESCCRLVREAWLTAAQWQETLAVDSLQALHSPCVATITPQAHQGMPGEALCMQAMHVAMCVS